MYLLKCLLLYKHFSQNRNILIYTFKYMGFKLFKDKTQPGTNRPPFQNRERSKNSRILAVVAYLTGSKLTVFYGCYGSF